MQLSVCVLLVHPCGPEPDSCAGSWIDGWQTNLANPHYRPEIFAQCTLINFIVTEKGLEDQLLAKVGRPVEPSLMHEEGGPPSLPPSPMRRTACTD